MGATFIEYAVGEGSVMMGSQIPAETVTKQCKNCETLFPAEIAGNGTCLDEFCSLLCEERFADEVARQTPACTHETYCTACAASHETEWNGRTQSNQYRRHWSNFLRHVRAIHCDEGEAPIDLSEDEHPDLYLYDREREEWKCYDEDDEYWHTVSESDLPDSVRDDHRRLSD